jgi:AraC-like DNA-binding protein
MLSKEIESGEMVVKRSVLTEDVDIHSHDFFELVYCEEGQVLNRINGKEYVFSKGDFLLLTPTDFHSESVTEQASTVQIHFDTELLDPELTSRLLKSDSVFLYSFDEKTASQLASLMYLLLDEYRTDSIGKSECISALFRCLTLYFFRAARLTAYRDTKPSPMQNALVYMHTHFRDNPSLSEVAEATGMSRPYFCYKFKQSTGQSFCDYLNKLKVGYAKKLLAATDITVTEICFRCGFNSVSNFLRVFSALVGTSPSAYRNTLSEESVAKTSLTGCRPVHNLI